MQQPMVTQLSIGSHQENPYIEAKVQYMAKGMVFGEWLALSGKLEEIILNPAKGEEFVWNALDVGMTVHVRQPRPNTRPGAQTLWRCFLRPLAEQPLYLQRLCRTDDVQPPKAEQKKVVEIFAEENDETISSVDPKTISLARSMARFAYIKKLVGMSDHAETDARKFSKTLGDLVDYCIAHQINPYDL